RARDDDEVALAWRRSEHARAEAVNVEAPRARRNHLDGAAGETERHRPQGGLAPPVDQLANGLRPHQRRGNLPPQRVEYRVNGRQYDSFWMLSHTIADCGLRIAD